MRAAVLQKDSPVTIEVVEQAARFRDLRQEWNALLQASASDCLFLTWEWLYTWWQRLSGKNSLFLLLVRFGEELVAIAPMMIIPRQLTRLLPFQTLEFLGTGSAGSDYLDLIIRRGMEEPVLSALSEHLCGKKLIAKLAQLKKGSSKAAQVALMLKERGWSHAHYITNVCPFVDLSGHTWTSYLGTLGPAHRYNYQRRLRQLRKSFEVRFERAESEREGQQALEVLVALHHRRWRPRGGSDALHTENLIAFHREFTRTALERGWLRLFTLWLGEKPAASLYGFRYGRTFYFYQSGFDPAYAKNSVGLVTMGLSIESALEEGAEEYDLLHGDEEYKFLWARQERHLERLEIFPPCVSGLLYKQAVGFGRAAKRWFGGNYRIPVREHS